MKAIALGADAAYMEKVETTIKSIAAHNNQVVYYVFNDDLPSNWFRLMARRLEAVGSRIVNVKISDNHLRNYHLPLSHLSYAAFFRYFIPDFVEEDKVLYLDSDIIVRGNLEPLFATELGDSPLAAVHDAFPGDFFNSGVMLINNAYWKAHKVSQALLDLTNQHHEEAYGDQGILNMHFSGQWLQLDARYNFFVGMDTVAANMGVWDWYDQAEVAAQEAVILHYTDRKPWHQSYINRLGEVWWFYYGKDWSDILLRKGLGAEAQAELLPQLPYRTAVFTHSADLEAIEYLITSLPQVQFAILAPTLFAGAVMDLQRYLNVTIYPMFNPYNLRDQLDHLDFYLDINHHREVEGVLAAVREQGKPIFAFSNTSHDQTGQSQVFNPDAPEDMVGAIQSYLETITN